MTRCRGTLTRHRHLAMCLLLHPTLRFVLNAVAHPLTSPAMPFITNTHTCEYSIWNVSGMGFPAASLASVLSAPSRCTSSSFASSRVRTCGQVKCVLSKVQGVFRL